MNKADTATFTVRERGPADARHLSIELEFDWSEEFKDAFKRAVPHGRGRKWDEELKKWFLAPEYLEAAAAIALEYFRRVEKVEGTSRFDLRTGERLPEQKGLFG